MLPPTFDPAKFPVPGGIEVPLASFPEGEYRLEIKVTDKVSGKDPDRDVNFTVKAASNAREAASRGRIIRTESRESRARLSGVDDREAPWALRPV